MDGLRDVWMVCEMYEWFVSVIIVRTQGNKFCIAWLNLPPPHPKLQIVLKGMNNELHAL